MIALLALALAAEPPPVGAGIALQLPVPEVHWLSDGTPVWLIEEHAVPLVRIEVSLRQGYLSASDPLAAILAGGLVGEDDQEIGVGAARVWADVEVLRGGEDEALAALRQALLQPRLRGNAVRTRRRHLARSRAGLVGVPGRVHNAALSEALFPSGHPLALRPSASDYRRITPDRARAAWTELLGSGAPAILVVGDTTAAEILPRLESHLLWLGGSGTPAALPAPDWRGEQVVMVDVPGSRRSWITLTVPAPALGAAELPAAEVVARVLGGDFTSRLSARLREQDGYVYDISAALTAWPGMGRLEITCSVSNDDLLGALDALREVVDGMIHTPPTAAEIDAARRAMVLQRAREVGSLAGLATDYGVGLLYGLSDEHESLRFAEYSALTQPQIEQAARALLDPEHVLWLITGDGAIIEPMLESSSWAPGRIRAGMSVLP